MGRIRLEILPGVSDVLNAQGVEHLVLEETIEEGATIGDFIKRLGSEHQAFGDIIFDTKTES